MPSPPAVRPTLTPLTGQDVDRVGRFLHEHLNDSVSAESWSRAVVPPWPVDAPNHGFLLTVEDRVVGAHLAFYSERTWGGERVQVCNLGAWCVLEEHRGDGVRLLRALLGQRGYVFTDLSPSGSVVDINRRLRFTELDTTTALVPVRPWRPADRGWRVTSDADEIATLLTGEERQIFLDHREAVAAHHLVAHRPGSDALCHVVVRRDRRKQLPLFASVLHVSDVRVFHESIGPLGRHVARRLRTPFLLTELRVVGHTPHGARVIDQNRAKMYRDDRVGPDDVDYLYSELTCVAW